LNVQSKRGLRMSDSAQAFFAAGVLLILEESRKRANCEAPQCSHGSSQIKLWDSRTNRAFFPEFAVRWQVVWPFAGPMRSDYIAQVRKMIVGARRHLTRTANGPTYV